MRGTTIAQSIPLLISPILTRIYTPEEFGVFALFISIVAVFSVIATARYEFAVLLAKSDEDAINVMALGFLVVTFISLLLLFFITFFHGFVTSLLPTSQLDLWLYFIPLMVFFIGVFNLLNHFNNRKKYYKDIANATILKSIVGASIQLLMGFMHQGVSGLISGQVISQFFANVKLAKNIFKEKILVKTIRISKMFHQAKKYKDFPKFQAPHALLNTFSSNIPTYMFSLFFNASIVGLYSLSVRIVFSPLMILANASAKVYNQKLSELHHQKEDVYGFTLRFLKSLLKKIILPFVLIVYFAPEIFAFVFSQEWKEAGLYTQVLSPWLFMIFFTSTISFIPSMLNQQKKALFLEVLYSFLRVLAIGIGVFYKDVYLGLILFSLVGFCMLFYNILWMLNSLKKVD